MTQPVLIAGKWRPADSIGSFHPQNPATGEALPDEYPVSSWEDCDAALTAAAEAAEVLRNTPREKIAQFLNKFADRLDARKAELAQMANLETALPVAPRLADVELPRTSGQLRQAAAAVLEGSWALPTIDTKTNIRSTLSSIGPVVVFGPNNFPFAFNGIGGGDFAAAIAAGNPVIAKGHPLHPGTTRLMAEEAAAALAETDLPRATVQLIYKTERTAAQRMVSDPRVGASAFTGGRAGGLALKAAADKAGKPIYLEMSSVNPVVFLPGALAERGAALAEEYAASTLMGGGQFCTNPGLVVLFEGDPAEQFITAVTTTFDKAVPATLLSAEGARSLAESVKTLQEAGAKLVTAGVKPEGPACRHPNTLLRVSGRQFLASPEALQTEAFGASALAVVARDAAEVAAIIDRLEGSLTGAIYSSQSGGDDAAYTGLAARLRQRVGRLLNDKMPTGVAVSSGMNHGGPYPSTGHPGFTAVGIPAALRRFAALHSYDNVREARLPAALRDKNPTGKTWRLIDGVYTTADVGK